MLHGNGNGSFSYQYNFAYWAFNLEVPIGTCILNSLLGKWNCNIWLITGAQPKAGTGHKMQTVSVVFSTLHCEGYTADLRYIAGSLLSWSLKSYPPFWKARGTEDSQEKDYSFLGNDTLPNLYDALVYEGKRKSDYLERQIYERLLQSEPSIVKHIENKSDLSKLSTVSEPSIVKFIENQSEHLSKLTLYHLMYKVI